MRDNLFRNMSNFCDISRKIYLASCLYDCIEDGNIRAVEKLLCNNQADPNIKIPGRGISPFHLAIGNDVEETAEEITRLFLQHGGNPNVRSDDNLTPLHVAAAWGRVGVLDLLLKCGADPTIRDDDGLTALDYAIDEKHWEIVSILVKVRDCLLQETQADNTPYDLTLDKVIINNGVVVAEYGVTGSDDPDDKSVTFDPANVLAPMKASVNSYVRNWCMTHADITQDNCHLYNHLSKQTMPIEQTPPSHSSDTDKDTSVVLEKNQKNMFSHKINDLNNIERYDVKNIVKNLNINDYSSSDENNLNQSSFSPKNIKYVTERDSQGNSIKYISSDDSYRRQNVTRESGIVTIPSEESYSLTPTKHTKKTRIRSIPSDESNSLSPTKYRARERKISSHDSYSPKYARKSGISTIPSDDSYSINRPKYIARESGIRTIPSDNSCSINPQKYARESGIRSIPSDDSCKKNSREFGIRTIPSGESSLNPKSRFGRTIPIDEVYSLNPQSIYGITIPSDESCLSSPTKIIAKVSGIKVIPSDAWSFSSTQSLNKCIRNSSDATQSRSSSEYQTCEENSVKSHEKNIFDSIMTLDLSNKMSDAQICEEFNSLKLHDKNIFDITLDLTNKLSDTHEKYIIDNSRMTLDLTNHLSDTQSLIHDKNIFSNSIMSVDLSNKLDKAYSEKQGIIDITSTRSIIEKTTDMTAHPTNVSCQISNYPEPECESIVSVEEEYKYTDREEGIVLIEKRILVNPKSDDLKSLPSSIPSSKNSSLPTTIDYDTDTLRKELTYHGEAPGPITTTTKRVYLKRLMRLQKQPMPYLSNNKDYSRVYSVELEKTLRNPDWTRDLSSYKELELAVVKQFSSPDATKRWREGLTKASFTYLLLDPRITNNLPCLSDKLSPEEIWKIFLSSIFYVGKGKRSRPYSHLYEAVNYWNNGSTLVKNKKIEHILDIWKAQNGVICLHVFQNVIPVEAYTREAAMISAIKKENLRNSKVGDFYGIAATWPERQKRLLGVFLLYRAMQIFLYEGERQLRPDDIGK